MGTAAIILACAVLLDIAFNDGDSIRNIINAIRGN